MVIDSHQHFWDLKQCEYKWLVPEYGPIYDSFTPEDLAPLLQETGVDKTVVVQAADTLEDTEYMLRAAEQNSWIAGIVAWLPLNDSAKARQQIEVLSKYSIAKGIRHLIHEEQDPDWVIQPEVIKSLRLLAEAGLTFDLVSVYPLHLNHIHTLIKEVPDLKIVIDHFAKPPIRSGDLSHWKRDIESVSQYSNVYTKFSGLSTAADMENWTTRDLMPAFQVVLDAFGASRVMFGSDWPVSILAGGYKKNFDASVEMIASLSIEEQAMIMGGSATKFYNLDV